MTCELRIKKNKNGGYTIIETMIAISLFIVIIMMGMGALLNANLLHEKSQNMNSIIDNLNFILEDISTNLRTGSNYRCLKNTDPLSDVAIRLSSNGQNCWGIAFEHQRDAQTGDPDNPNDQWIYFISSDGKIWKSSQGPYTNFPVNFVQLTPDEIEIDPATSFFYVSGAEPPPNTQQPFVTIKLSGEITFKNVTTPFTLRTAVSQRNVDLY